MSRDQLTSSRIYRKVNQYFTLVSISLLINLIILCLLLINSAAIVTYDYYLTFAEEVERFWMGGRLNWASGLFYLNRYLVLLGHIPIMLEFFWKTSAGNKMQVSTLFETRKLQPTRVPILR